MTEHTHPTMAVTTIDLKWIVEDFLGRIKDEILTEFRAELLAEVDRRLATTGSVGAQLSLPPMVDADAEVLGSEDERAIWVGRLSGLIRSRGQSYAKFGREVGFSDASLGNWNSGRTKPSEESHERLLAAFGLTAADVRSLPVAPPVSVERDEPSSGLSGRLTRLIHKQTAVVLAKQLPALRAARRLSVRQLANASGNSRSAITAWELGANQISTTRVEGLLTALGVTARDVLGKAEYSRLVGGQR